LNEGLFTYRPHATLWLHVNHKPVIRGVDAGIWSRVRFLPFEVSFEGREDRDLEAKLKSEASGILAWCVRGAREWYESGLGTAEAVKTATASYREESDILAPFVDARLDVDPKGNITRKRVVALYTAWCESSGEEPLKTVTLYRMLQDREGVTPIKIEGERGFRGISERSRS
jgi:putative DNA primase/helicase